MKRPYARWLSAWGPGTYDAEHVSLTDAERADLVEYLNSL
jgi:cytochrome c1